MDHTENFCAFAGELNVEDLTSHTIRGFINHELSRRRRNGPLSSSSVHKAYSVVWTLVNWRCRER